MGFSARDILEEFEDAARRGCSSAPSSFDDLAEQHRRAARAIRLRAYHKLHARPEWRKARAAKMRAYRARLKAEKVT